MQDLFFEIHQGEGPFIATAIHEGNKLREELISLINPDEDERLREEDPYTGIWADIANTTIKGKYSRFETDLNRPRDKAVYKTPDDAWGLQVWKKELPDSAVQRSLEKYDKFYSEVKKVIEKKIFEYGGVLIYDFHSYNHRREGRDNPAENPAKNPEINIGTKNMNRAKWNDVINTFIRLMSSFDYSGRKLDVRENIKFKGGYFSQWIYENYPEKSCVLAIEVKKFFMDEWTGVPDYEQIYLLKNAFKKTVWPVIDEFQKILNQN